MSDVLATNAELEALQEAAGIPNLPTQLTFEARLAISGEGPRAYDWSDKPHRIVFDLCREIEKNAALNTGKEVMPPVPVSDTTNTPDIGPGDQDAVAGAAGHRSDCAIHNAPAYPAGPCDCGFSAGAAEDFETQIIDGWIARNEPAAPLVSADAILHGLGVMLDGKHVPVREFYVGPEGLFKLKGDTLGLRCATTGCGQHVSVRLERDGVGSDYCEPCGLRAVRI
jgi:hypothetical protein